MNRKENWFSKIDVRTIIYFAVLAFLFIPMAFTGELNYNRMLVITFFATGIYIIATKRWFYIQIAAALLFVSFAIQYTSSLYVQVKIQSANFIVSSFVLGFVMVLFVSTFSRHAEWTIHSPWIATIYGSIAGILTEYIIITTNNERNVYLVGIPGMIVIFAVGFAYLVFGTKVRVHKPVNVKNDDMIDTLQASLQDNSYSLKRNKKDELFIYDDTDETSSYRVFITTDKIAHLDANKEWKEWLKVHDKKSQYIYAWLLQESVRSFEVRGPKPIKSEQFIIISIGATTSEPSVIDVNIPRSKRQRHVAFMSVAENDMKHVGKQIEKATALLKVNK